MFCADLHIHSKYSRATSGDCDLEHLAQWAARKGIAVLATGDFTHPKWFEEIREKLVAAEPGLFRLRPDLEKEVERGLGAAESPVRFTLEVEISTIYKRDGRTRKVHHLVYVPELDCARRFIQSLSRIGNLNSDGRPILGLGWTPGTCWRSRSSRARAVTWFPPTFGPLGSPCSARSRASTRSSPAMGI